MPPLVYTELNHTLDHWIVYSILLQNYVQAFIVSGGMFTSLMSLGGSISKQLQIKHTDLTCMYFLFVHASCI